MSQTTALVAQSRKSTQTSAIIGDMGLANTYKLNDLWNAES